MNRRQFFVSSGFATCLGALFPILRRDVRFEWLGFKLSSDQLGWRKIVNGVPVKIIWFNDCVLRTKDQIQKLDMDFYQHCTLKGTLRWWGGFKANPYPHEVLFENEELRSILDLRSWSKWSRLKNDS